MEPPHLFVDRSLGAVQLPQLLRDAGWLLTTLVEHYGRPGDEAVADVDWLTLCGRGLGEGCRRKSGDLGAVTATGATHRVVTLTLRNGAAVDGTGQAGSLSQVQAL